MHIQCYVNTVIQDKLPNCPTHVVMQTTEQLEVIMWVVVVIVVVIAAAVVVVVAAAVKKDWVVLLRSLMTCRSS